MRAIPSPVPEVVVIESKVFSDERGLFFESYNRRAFADATGVAIDFVQDNHSRSVKNTLRGLHYQIQQPQGKLVRVVCGEVFDVAVDLRRSSTTFGKWTGTHLSAKNMKLLWLPARFAHGFVVLSDYAELLYKTTDYWALQHERAILWNDPALAITWPLTDAPILSAKDRSATRFANAEVFG